MSGFYKQVIEILKDFVHVNLLLLEWKKSAASSFNVAKTYSEKSKKLLEKFQEKKQKLKLELSHNSLTKETLEKRHRQMKHLQEETIKLQYKLDQLMKLRKKPAIYNANTKWKTRDSSIDSTTAAAIVAAASKTGEACNHQTQFIQDRRLSDSFDFSNQQQYNLNNNEILSSFDSDNVDKTLKKEFVNKTYTKRAELVSHIILDDVRRVVANEIYESETTWLDLSATDLEICKLVLDSINNNEKDLSLILNNVGV